MNQNIIYSISPNEFKNLIRDAVKELVPVAQPEGKEKLNQKQAAKYLGVSQPTIISWKKKELIPYHQIPNTRKIYYLRSELKEAAKQLSNF